MSTVQSELSYTDWSQWNPNDYNKEYYSEITLDGQYLMEWVVESVADLSVIPVAIEFGTGPTILHTLPLAPKIKELHLAEYLEVNRNAVKGWLRGDEDAYDWRQFTLEFLKMEGNANPTDSDALAREDLVRRLTTNIFPGDAGLEDPLGPEKRGFYPLVTTLCCADSATNDKATYRRYMRNISSLVAPGGRIVISACAGHAFYRVGENIFPGASIGAHDMLGVLEDNGFTDLDIRVRQVPDSSEQGFASTILARATKG